MKHPKKREQKWFEHAEKPVMTAITKNETKKNKVFVKSAVVRLSVAFEWQDIGVVDDCFVFFVKYDVVRR